VKALTSPVSLRNLDVLSVLLSSENEATVDIPIRICVELTFRGTEADARRGDDVGKKCLVELVSAARTCRYSGISTARPVIRPAFSFA
jgi:hypothetical protein